MRSAASIWSPLLKRRHRVFNGLVHVSDLLPTFASLAGVPVEDGLDGIDIWSALSNDDVSPRNSLIGNLDEGNYLAYIEGQYKYINGTVLDGIYDGFLSVDGTEDSNATFGKNYAQEILSSNAGKAFSKFSLPTAKEILKIRESAKATCEGKSLSSNQPASERCNPLSEPCLFDIKNDPCETVNLAKQLPEVFSHMADRVAHYASIAMAPRNKPDEPRSNPANFNGTWTWWYDELGVSE